MKWRLHKPVTVLFYFMHTGDIGLTNVNVTSVLNEKYMKVHFSMCSGHVTVSKKRGSFCNSGGYQQMVLTDSVALHVAPYVGQFLW